MSSLVKVSPYSKWNFKGEKMFNLNWCNITLMLRNKKKILLHIITSVRDITMECKKVRYLAIQLYLYFIYLDLLILVKSDYCKLEIVVENQ
jgi:hypothetical protein